MNFLTFLDDFKALMIHERDNLMIVDPRFLKQHMIRSSGINNMRSSGFLHGPKGPFEVDVAKSERLIAFEPNTLIGSFVSRNPHCLEH